MPENRTFKDPVMQRIYNQFRKDPPTGNRITISMGSACGSAYIQGFQYPAAKRHRIVQGTPAYAAWAAGVDNARERVGVKRAQITVRYADLMKKSESSTHSIRRCVQCHQVIHEQPLTGVSGKDSNRANAKAVEHWKQYHPEGYKRLLAKWQREAEERENLT